MPIRIMRLLLLALAALTACTARPHERLVNTAVEPAPLPVVRVQAATGLRAGLPLTAGGALSACVSAAPGDDAVVVDGVPAKVHPMMGNDGSVPGPLSALNTAYPAFAHGPLHTFDYTSGDQVLLAGYRYAENPTPLEVLRTAPRLVPATVEEELGDYVLVRAPADSYAGFIGGPAGEYRDSSFSAWGIVIEELESPSPQYSQLCVYKLHPQLVGRISAPVTRPVFPKLSSADELLLLARGLPISDSTLSIPPGCVLHMAGSYSGSGFAVTADLVVTAAHVAGNSDVLAVGGLPATVLARGTRDQTWPCPVDWVIARTAARLAPPLPLDPRDELPCGQRVILGGLPGPVDWSVPASMLEKHPVFVAGTVRKCHRERAGLTAQIDVPAADYHGCSGGPVMTVADDGQLRLWGLLTGITWPVFPIDRLLGHSTLIITPIPRDLTQYAPDAFTFDAR